MDRKYSRRNNNICRIYIQKNTLRVRFSCEFSTALILIDETVYFKDTALTNLIYNPQ